MVGVKGVGVVSQRGWGGWGQRVEVVGSRGKGGGGGGMKGWVVGFKGVRDGRGQGVGGDGVEV